MEREAIAKSTHPPLFDVEHLEQTGATARLAEWRKIAEAALTRQV
jgi:hypothetical protein